jgi:hypothetical protein
MEGDASATVAGCAGEMRTIWKRMLIKRDNPPDSQKKAAQTVLQQAELLCGGSGARAGAPPARPGSLPIPRDARLLHAHARMCARMY